MTELAIELRDVGFRYQGADERALHGVDLAVPRGALCALVGANGAGKTTLCNVVRGFAPSFYNGELEGTVRVGGRDLSDAVASELGVDIGYVFQNPFMQITGSKDTVFEEIAFGLENLGRPVEEIRARVEEVIVLLRLEALRNNNPMELSGGQKQRVALASVLAMDPSVFVIDEPTSQLDPQSSDEIFQIIAMLCSRGATVLLAEHKIELIAQFADHVAVIADGRIVSVGPPAEVLGDPALADHGVRPPAFARAAHRLRAAGVSLPEIPVTYESAVPVFESALKETT